MKLNIRHVPAFSADPGIEVVPWSSGEGCTFFYEDKTFDLERCEFDELVQLYLNPKRENDNMCIRGVLGCANGVLWGYTIKIHDEWHRVELEHFQVLVGLGFLAFSKHFNKKERSNGTK